MEVKLRKENFKGVNFYRIFKEPENGKSYTEKKALLLLHGYGSSKEEILPFGINLVFLNSEWEVFIPDLPGHGESDEILSQASVKKFLSLLKDFDFFLVCGHSLGARISLLTEAENYLLISPPLSPEFSGSKKELLKTLRARRVKEEKPYQGLTELLTALPVNFVENKNYFLVYSKNDLKSVLEFVNTFKNRCTEVHSCRDSFHNDIITSYEFFDVLKAWVKKYFQK